MASSPTKEEVSSPTKEVNEEVSSVEKEPLTPSVEPSLPTNDTSPLANDKPEPTPSSNETSPDVDVWALSNNLSGLFYQGASVKKRAPPPSLPKEEETSTLTKEEIIKRFLFTHSYQATLAAGDVDKYNLSLQHPMVIEMASSAPRDFCMILKDVSEKYKLPRRKNLFYLIAYVVTHREVEMESKVEIKRIILGLIENDREFFDFVQYFTSFRTEQEKRHMCTFLRKLVIRFYRNKTSDQLARLVTAYWSCHRWSHKTLIKMCHVKSNDPQMQVIVRYVLFGKKGIEDMTNPDMENILTLLRKSSELRSTEDTERAAELIQELNATVDQVNSKLNKSEEVWAAAVQNLTTREVLQMLYKFYRMNFMKQTSKVYPKIIESLNNDEKIKSCNLHPIEVFMYLKIFEKGGKDLDYNLIKYLESRAIKKETLKKIAKRDVPKCQAVVTNVNKCLVKSYQNVQTTGKRYMVTIDRTTKANGSVCSHNRLISAIEATYTLIKFLVKMEKSVTLAVFKNDEVELISIKRCHSLQQFMDRLGEAETGDYITPGAPMEWALTHKKQFDIFINFMDSDWLSHVPAQKKDKAKAIQQALTKYREKMKVPDAKFVRMHMGPVLNYNFETVKNTMTVVGFDGTLPWVLDAFCRDHFC